MQSFLGYISNNLYNLTCFNKKINLNKINIKNCLGEALNSLREKFEKYELKIQMKI